MIYTIYIILYLKNLSIIMQLDYKYLREKYLKYFKGNENLCDHLLTDVIFGFNELYDILKDNKIHSVLEIGSGTGLLLNELKAHFSNIEFEGLDPNESGFHNYKEISQKLEKENNSFFINNASVENFNKEKKYDLIFSVNVFEHVKNHPEYINKTLKLLKKDGVNIIISPNYDFPYEPHFVLPLIINKDITYSIFKYFINKHEAKTEEHGLWRGLNLNGKKKIEKILKDQNISYTFDYEIKNRILERVFKDKVFKTRQGFAATLTIIGSYLKIDKLFFNFLKIPFPYMKLIIKK